MLAPPFSLESPGLALEPQNKRLFSSVREAWLWAVALLVVVAAYSTLGLAGTLVSALRERGVFDTVFVAGFALFWIAILTNGLRLRPARLEIGIGCALLAVYLMAFARIGIPAERTHLFEYGVVAFLIQEALLERARNGRGTRFPRWSAFAVASLLGMLDELLQAFLPSRTFELRDVLFNLLACAMAIGSCAALEWARQTASGNDR